MKKVFVETVEHNLNSIDKKMQYKEILMKEFSSDLIPKSNENVTYTDKEVYSGLRTDVYEKHINSIEDKVLVY